LFPLCLHPILLTCSLSRFLVSCFFSSCTSSSSLVSLSLVSSLPASHPPHLFPCRLFPLLFLLLSCFLSPGFFHSLLSSHFCFLFCVLSPPFLSCFLTSCLLSGNSRLNEHLGQMLPSGCSHFSVFVFIKTCFVCPLWSPWGVEFLPQSE